MNPAEGSAPSSFVAGFVSGASGERADAQVVAAAGLDAELEVGTSPGFRQYLAVEGAADHVPLLLAASAGRSSRHSPTPGW